MQPPAPDGGRAGAGKSPPAPPDGAIATSPSSDSGVAQLAGSPRLAMWILRLTKDRRGTIASVSWRDDVERDEDHRMVAVDDAAAAESLRHFLQRNRPD